MPQVHDLDSTDDVHCLWHTMDGFSIFMYLQTYHTMSVDTQYLEQPLGLHILSGCFRTAIQQQAIASQRSGQQNMTSPP